MSMKDLLGGKGANLAEMCNTGVPVPPGFTVSTEVCNIYFNNNRQVPAEVDEQIKKALAKPDGAYRATFEDKILMSGK